MYKTVIALIIIFVTSVPGIARENIQEYPIKEALNLEQAKDKLSSDVKFYFGDEYQGKVTKDFGTFRTNKKTNALGKSDKEACQWVFLSAMIELEERAIEEGGNAVINIKSYYNNDVVSSEKTFRCGAGNFLAGVALVGKVVKIPE